jgi:hypothetical protein
MQRHQQPEDPLDFEPKFLSVPPARRAQYPPAPAADFFLAAFSF